MKIINNLPFERCENCPEFVLKVSESYLPERQLKIECKHAWLCEQLKKEQKEDESFALQGL